MFVLSRVNATRKDAAGFVALRGRNLPKSRFGQWAPAQRAPQCPDRYICTTRLMIGVAVWSGVRLCIQAAAEPARIQTLLCP